MRVQNAILNQEGVDNLEKRRDDLRSQLRRLNYQFEHGLIDEADTAAYEKKAQRLIREINTIVVPNTTHVVETGEQLITFSAAWAKADMAHKHAILREMFEAIYVDTDAMQIVSVKPYAEFVPLFRQTQMIERDYQFVLENKKAAQDLESSERSYVQYGSDGIRTRDLCLDRAAC